MRTWATFADQLRKVIGQCLLFLSHVEWRKQIDPALAPHFSQLLGFQCTSGLAEEVAGQTVHYCSKPR